MRKPPAPEAPPPRKVIPSRKGVNKAFITQIGFIGGDIIAIVLFGVSMDSMLTAHIILTAGYFLRYLQT